MNTIYFIRRILIILFCLFIAVGFSQTILKSTVKDKSTNQAIAYCNIFNKTLQKGVISNADGIFSIEALSLNDSIGISYLGFETQILSAKTLQSLESVYLIAKQYELHEVEIQGDNDYLYDLLSDCRKTLKKQKTNHISKAFFQLNTQTKNQPLELLECYYNAHQRSGKLEELHLKNGRYALLPLDSSVFLNHNTSQVFNKINLTHDDKFLPNIILHHSKVGMKKRFDVRLEYADEEVFLISFKPKQEENNSFSGEIWIDKRNKHIKKIYLEANNITKHPFVAQGTDSLSNVSMNTNISFKDVKSEIIIDHIIFDLKLNYFSSRKSHKRSSIPNRKREMNIKTVLYFYDLNSPFILPYFDYNNQITDYRKISIIPFNEDFWVNSKLLLTQEQKSQMDVISQEGYFINYVRGNYGSEFMKNSFKTERGTKIPRFYEHSPYIFWASKKRVEIIEEIEKIDIPKTQTIGNIDYRMAQSNPYHLYVQILLDINPNDSSYTCKSYTIFDLTKSTFNIDTDEYTHAFVNIYFDLCEMERQNMEEKLKDSSLSLEQINTIYQETLSNLNEMTNIYLKEVKRGSNFIALQKWNDKVIENLGINNLQLFIPEKDQL